MYRQLSDDVGMPWVVHEVAPLLDPVAQAQEVLGHRLNILIGHFLAGHPNSRIGAILDAVGSQRATVRQHLQELEAVGVVTVDIDVPPGQRQGPFTRYSVNRDRWMEIGVRLTATCLRNSPRLASPLPSEGASAAAAPAEAPRVYWAGDGSRKSWSKFDRVVMAGQDVRIERLFAIAVAAINASYARADGLGAP